MISKRTVGLLLLQEDPEILELVREKEKDRYDRIQEILIASRSDHSRSLNYLITMRRKAEVERILPAVITHPDQEERSTFSERLSRATMNPGYGFFALFMALFLIDNFAGAFGLPTPADFFHNTLFANHIEPLMNRLLAPLFPWSILHDLFIGEGGVLTFLLYLIGAILPDLALVSAATWALIFAAARMVGRKPAMGYGLYTLFLVLYLGLYQFVGVFGAGSIVDFLEASLFETHINPFVTKIFERLIPWEILSSLFVGEYGIFTLGIRYAIAIILPIVGTFFIAFSILEDTGYFPRLAMLVDRIFKRIGLSGRAVIPMVLGLGCDTMATMVTRILETTRERIIGTLLLALAIPCSAQLGVIIALLSEHPLGVVLWVGVVIGELFLIGYLTAKVMPGARPSFYMEVPPLRLPQLSNVLAKTYTRMQWYFLEILPLFIIASGLIWIGQITGLFQVVISGVEPLVRLLGLPDETAVAFLFGFFRRDYGAAGLFDLHQDGLLSGVQLVVAAVTLTLFIPCIAQFLVMKKERGLKTTLLMTALIIPLAFGTGFLLNLILTQTGVQL